MIGCTPDPGEDKPFDVMLKNLAECKEFKATAKWAHVYSKTRPIEQDNLTHEHFTPWQPISDQKSGKDDEEAKKKVVQTWLPKT